jgi:3'-phosphoadenosine 5'-phosphosulfate sulfotransferase (PAPS reductase)/FAD synthetase
MARILPVLDIYQEYQKLLLSDRPILVAFSGGKDSIAMVLHLLELGIDRNRIHLHHHDVDGGGPKLFDWACTESYCKEFARVMRLKIFFSYREGGIMREVMRNNEGLQNVHFQTVPDGPFQIAYSKKDNHGTRLRWPAVSASLAVRWCSSVAKIDVLSVAIANNPAYTGDIFILTGERRQESANRAKYNEVEYHRTYANKRRAIGIRPIIDWTEAQVWAIIKRWAIQPHPAYMLGWNRCSCQLCIFGSANLWATINEISPEKVDTIAGKEDLLNFTLYDKLSIREKIAKGKAIEGLDLYWVKNATGEFFAPMIVNEWQLPPGAYSLETAGSL